MRREAQPAADAEPIEVRGTNVAAQVAAAAGAHEPPIATDDDAEEVEGQILAQAMAASMDQEPAVRAPPPRMAPPAGAKKRAPPSREREASELRSGAERRVVRAPGERCCS